MLEESVTARRPVRVIADSVLSPLVDGLRLGDLRGPPGAQVVLRLGCSHSAVLLSDLGCSGEPYGLIWLDAAIGGVLRAALRDGLVAAPDVVLFGHREPAVPPGVTAFSRADVADLGVATALAAALSTVRAARGFAVAYGTAVTDLGVPEGRGGLSPRETHEAMALLAATPGLLALEVTGLEPGGEHVAELVESCVLSCFPRSP